jgi:uncharacterized membrane protein YfcA
VVIAALIDVSRLAVYAPGIAAQRSHIDYVLLTAAVLSAFIGAFLGNRYLKKLTIESLQIFVAVMLTIAALGLISGLL